MSDEELARFLQAEDEAADRQQRQQRQQAEEAAFQQFQREQGTCLLCHNEVGTELILELSECGHRMCADCLRAHLQQWNGSGSPTCPCGTAGGRGRCAVVVPERVMRQVLTSEQLNELQERQMKAFLSASSSSYVTCPSCNETFEAIASASSAPTSATSTPRASTSAGGRETAEDGRELTAEQVEHRNRHRFRCGSCSANFCRLCQTTPYHLGYTCEEYQRYTNAPHCRYCEDVLLDTPPTTSSTTATTASTTSASASAPTSFVSRILRSNSKKEDLSQPPPPPKPINVCSKPECLDKYTNQCIKLLPVCRHPCDGIRGERHCLPCIHDDCERRKADSQTRAEFCNICLTGDHMVLTSSGWKSIRLVVKDDEVASFNIATSCMEWKRVTATQRFPASQQRLFRMQGSDMDIVATEDHSMLVARIDEQGNLEAGEKSIDYETVGQLLPPHQRYDADSTITQFEHCSERAVLRSGLNRQPAFQLLIPGMEAVCEYWWRKNKQLSFLRFVGFWLGDGHLELNRRKIVAIGQHKLKSCAWLVDLLDEVFPRWWSRWQYIDDEGIKYTHAIRCPPLYEWVRVMAVGPAGYHPGFETSYPHFAFDERVEELELESQYRQLPPIRQRHKWTEAAMLAAFDVGPVLRACTVCGDEHGTQLFCSGSRCAHVDDITRAHPACVDRADDHAAFAEPWYCRRCEDEWANRLRRPRKWAGGDELPTLSRFLQKSFTVYTADSDPTLVGTFGGANTSPLDHVHGNHWRALRPLRTDMQQSTAGDGGDQSMEVEEGAVVFAVAARQQFNPPYAYVPGTAIMPWNNALWRVGNGHWFYLKRWMGPNVAGTFARMSQPQAAALIEGFCRADGRWKSIRFEDGEPTCQWQASNSSMPLIHHLQLIGQLAGAAVDFALSAEKGTVHKFGDRDSRVRADHWRLTFDFGRAKAQDSRQPIVRTAALACPTDVSANAHNARGYFDYKDDGYVYDISVEGNRNFLTQRLSVKRIASSVAEAGEGVRAHPVFVGNW